MGKRIGVNPNFSVSLDAYRTTGTAFLARAGDALDFPGPIPGRGADVGPTDPVGAPRRIRERAPVAGVAAARDGFTRGRPPVTLRIPPRVAHRNPLATGPIRAARPRPPRTASDMFPSHRTVRAFALLVPVLLAQGCATVGPGETAPDEEGLERIAQDLVFTLVQLSGTNPMTTTVQMSDPVTPFGREVAALVREAGYGVQTVPDDRGRNYLRYRDERVSSELGTETRYAVSIGDVTVERAYGTVDGRIVPLSPQRVDGARGQGVSIDDTLFDKVSDPTTHTVRFADESGPLFTDAGAAADAAPVPAPLPAPAPGSFAARVKQNLYDGLSSNYAELFASYADVDTTTITFANDSMRIGEAQKRTIEGYAEQFRPETDLLSVIGCSHGNTAIDNGNGVLALGRANRVKESLVFAGVPPGAVLDEGCWAGQAHEFMPARGVVLTLKRRLG